MRVFRWMIAILFILLGLPFFLFTLHIVRAPASDQFTQLGSTDIELISMATQFISNFHEKSYRLPTDLEFSAWVATKDAKLFRYEGRGYSYYSGPFSIELINSVGSPPEDAFTLNFWDGDSFVTYSSWFGNGRLAHIPDSSYYLFNSKIADVVVSSTVWLLLFVFSAIFIPERHV